MGLLMTIYCHFERILTVQQIEQNLRGLLFIGPLCNAITAFSCQFYAISALSFSAVLWCSCWAI